MAGPSPEAETVVHDRETPESGQAEYASLASDAADAEEFRPAPERRRYPVSHDGITRALQQLEAARGNDTALRTIGQELIDEGMLKLHEGNEAGALEATNRATQVVLDTWEALRQAVASAESPAELRQAVDTAETRLAEADDPHEAPTVVLPPRGEEAALPEPAAPPTPHPAAEDSPPLELHMASVDREARTRALQAAEQKLQQEAAETKGIKGIIRNIWKGALAHEYYKQKYASEFEAQIRESDNQLIHEGGSREAYYRANEALIDRLVEGQLNPDVELHQDERVEQMGSSETEQKFQTGIKERIKEYARGTLDTEGLREARTRLLNELQAEDPKLLDGAHMLADNLISVAEQAKAMADNDVILDRLVDGMKFYADQARGGVRTEVHRNLGDKLVERAQHSRLGRFANETTIASAVSIAYSAATLASKRTVGATMATVLPGAGAGLFAGMRENLRFKQERAQHMRERAEGTDFGEPGEGKRRGTYFEASGRREKMEAARYETVSAQSLTESLQLPSGSLTTEAAQSLLENLATARARNQVSNTRDVDLISFSAVDKVDAERLELDLAIAGAKAALRQWYEAADPATRATLGNHESFQQVLHAQREAAGMELRGEIKAKDRTFAKMKARAVAKATAKGVMTGLAFGIVSQEMSAFFEPNQQGELESLLGHHDAIRGDQTAHQTLLRSLFSGSSGNGHAAEAAATGPIFHERIDAHNTVRLPHGFVLRHHGPNGRGGMTLLDGDKPVARGLHMNQEGFTPQSQEVLQKLGIGEQHHLVAVHEARQVVEHTSAKEYFAHNPAGTTHVERTLWYDNDTPHIFDKNELRLWWGGHDNNGLVHSDNYEFNVSQMTPDGSYHTPFSANAQALMREGRLRVLLSASQDTQSHPFSVPIDARGNAEIPRDSVAGHSLFSRSDGHAVFRGRFAEVAQVLGRSHGREQVRILATYEGHGVETIRHSVTRELPTQRLVTTLQTPVEHLRSVTDAPPVIPINSRREMEPALENPEYTYYDRPMDEAEREHYRERRSESLNADPNAQLDEYTETEAYLARQSRQDRRFAERLAAQVTEPMGSDCKVAIIIPVAGHQEGANIYRTLRSYGGQTANPNSYEIVTFVNRPAKNRNGNPIADDGTLAEIERFRHDYPDVPVRVMEAVMPDENPSIGQIRKYATDATLIRHHARGKNAGNLILISNDADSLGVVPEYIQTFTDRFEADPNMDALLGQVDWDPTAYLQNPLLHVTTRFFQYVDAAERRVRSGGGSSGANFGFRASIYAGVGGYENVEGAGEDLVFGRAVRAARAGADDGRTPVGFAGTRNSRIYTSARRALVALKEGLSPYEQWNGVFSAFDDEVRKLNIDKESNPVDFDNPAEVKAFQNNLETLLNRTVSLMMRWQEAPASVAVTNPEGLSNFIDRSLRYLGISYAWSDKQHIRITGIDGLVRGLRNYGTEGYEIYRNRTQTA